MMRPALRQAVSDSVTAWARRTPARRTGSPRASGRCSAAPAPTRRLPASARHAPCA